MSIASEMYDVAMGRREDIAMDTAERLLRKLYAAIRGAAAGGHTSVLYACTTEERWVKDTAVRALQREGFVVEGHGPSLNVVWQGK